MSVLVHVVKANLQERAITISHWNFTQYSGRKYHVFSIHHTTHTADTFQLDRRCLMISDDDPFMTQFNSN